MNTVVCWDFDETLGYFRPLEFGFLGMPVPSAMSPARLKPGIAALLDSLRDFTHVVTTAAVGEYAKRVLRREDGICAGEGKDYSLVGSCFGIAEDQLRSRLAIVGNDAERDADCRCRQVVMIHDARMMDLPSAPLASVLRGLVREGDGDIKRGFDAYFDRSGGEPLVLRDNIKLKLEYWGSYAEKRVHPVVSTILPMC